jgi:hypothetical protein
VVAVKKRPVLTDTYGVDIQHAFLQGAGSIEDLSVIEVAT